MADRDYRPMFKPLDRITVTTGLFAGSNWTVEAVLNYSGRTWLTLADCGHWWTCAADRCVLYV